MELCQLNSCVKLIPRNLVLVVKECTYIGMIFITGLIMTLKVKKYGLGGL